MGHVVFPGEDDAQDFIGRNPNVHFFMHRWGDGSIALSWDIDEEVEIE